MAAMAAVSLVSLDPAPVRYRLQTLEQLLNDEHKTLDQFTNDLN